MAWIATPYLRGRWRIVPWAAVATVGSDGSTLVPPTLGGIEGVGLGLAVGAAANLIVGVPAGTGR